MIAYGSSNILASVIGFPEAFILITPVVFLLYYLVYYFRNSSSENWSVDDLTSEEKEIVEMIRKRNGEINQVVISENTDWSDAKVSRLTSSLISKEVIDKSRRDRENYISLKEDNEV